MINSMNNRGKLPIYVSFELTDIYYLIECIHWAPSRDWSRLFVLSKEATSTESEEEKLYIEFYNFNLEK